MGTFSLSPTENIVISWVILGNLMLDTCEISHQSEWDMFQGIALRNLTCRELEALPLTPSVCELWEKFHAHDPVGLSPILSQLAVATAQN